MYVHVWIMTALYCDLHHVKWHDTQAFPNQLQLCRSVVLILCISDFGRFNPRGVTAWVWRRNSVPQTKHWWSLTCSDAFWLLSFWWKQSKTVMTVYYLVANTKDSQGAVVHFKQMLCFINCQEKIYIWLTFWITSKQWIIPLTLRELLNIRLFKWMWVETLPCHFWCRG